MQVEEQDKLLPLASRLVGDVDKLKRIEEELKLYSRSDEEQTDKVLFEFGRLCRPNFTLRLQTYFLSGHLSARVEEGDAAVFRRVVAMLTKSD
jgi:hypothetical protein